MGIIAFFFLIRILAEYLFTIKARRSYSMFSLDNSNIIDVALCVIIAIRLEREYKVYRSGLSDLESGSAALHETYYNNIYVKEDDDEFLSYLYAIIVLIGGIKCLYLIRFTYLLGPLIKMILLMFKDFMIFLFLIVLNIAIFTVIGYMLFKEVEEYSAGYKVSKTLIASALGGFDYAILDSAELGETTGAIFLTFYLLVTSVLALNLLIAILSNVYNEVSVKVNILYIIQVLY